MNAQDAIMLTEYIDNLKSTVKNAISRLEKLWNSWEINVDQLEVHEVIGAILARQITLTKSFSNNPQLWNNDLAPLILRVMTDNYISLHWILKDPLDRTRKFIAYGIGNEKLQAEKRKMNIAENKLDQNEDELLMSQYQWIDFHRYSFLTTVDVGSWSGISTRQMAIDSDCKDFYDLVYDPFSNCTHNSWNHIGKYNVVMSTNPLHKFLRMPYVPTGEISSFYADLSVKYLSMVFDSFETKYFPDFNEKSILDIYNFNLDRLKQLMKESK